MTVRCKTDVQTAIIDYDQFKELYFQNPQFGFRLLHLVVERLQRSGSSFWLSVVVLRHATAASMF
jgi:CRP-like cAMP-binding protein